METIRTQKIKLLVPPEHFKDVADSYLTAANWLSQIVFDNKKTRNYASLAREFYGTVRGKFNLTSQLTCSLFRHVSAVYGAMKSKKQWHRVIFKKPTIPIVWKRDFNLTKKGLKIWGKLIPYRCHTIPDGRWSDSKLKFIRGQWYLCLTIRIETPEPLTFGTIVGIDSGIKNIITAVDHKTNKTLYISGSEMNHRRLRIRQTRAKVASVGTKSAKRLLKRLSGHEAAVTQNMLHLASKRVVTWAKSVGARLIVMEDLTGVRRNSSGVKKHRNSKQNRAAINRWPFARMSFYIKYKAEAEGIGFETVSPSYTSQACPKCGHTEKANRNGLAFRCVACGYSDNADRVGAMNIALRSILRQQVFTEERAIVN